MVFMKVDSFITERRESSVLGIDCRLSREDRHKNIKYISELCDLESTK